MTAATRLAWGTAVVVAAAAVGCLAACAGASPDPSRPARLATQPRPVPSPTPPPPSGPAAFAYSGELTQGGWLRGTVPGGTVALTLDGAPVDFTRDGRFLVAFDRDAAPAATLIARLGDGRTVSAALAVAPRAWDIEHVAAGASGAMASEAFRVIRAAELARIDAARRIASDSTGWLQDFAWPARGRISGQFGAQRIYRGTPGSYHSGIDIAGGSGAPFAAPADGVVVLAAREPFTLEGLLLMIDHGNGLNSAFLHCSEITVREGDRVRRGQVIGRIGATGRATGPHLHWSLKWRDARLDPILFTGAMPPR